MEEGIDTESSSFALKCALEFSFKLRARRYLATRMLEGSSLFGYENATALCSGHSLILTVNTER